MSAVVTTNFYAVSAMNEAFGNPKGDPSDIDWSKVRRQCINIVDEFAELQTALGLTDERTLSALLELKAALRSAATRQDEHDQYLDFDDLAPYEKEPNLKNVRDALCDIHVFGYGAHHLMGIDADRDMRSVVSAVMSRFIKDEHDKEMTVIKHAAAGVTEVYFIGEYPTMVMKSLKDQPDAPKGKFLKSASYSEPVFYDVHSEVVHTNRGLE